MKPVIVDKIINQPVNKVWKAITEHSEMIQWFFDNIPDFKAEVGFKTWFVVASEERTFYHLWKVTEVVPNKIIKVEWTYPDYVKEPFLVTFELSSESENQTEVKVSAEGIEKFYHFDIPEFTRESCEGGWEYFTSRLKEYLEQ